MANDQPPPEAVSNAGVTLPVGQRHDAEFGPDFNPVKHHLDTARWLAYLLFAAFGLSLGFCAVWALFNKENAVMFLQVLGPLTGGPLAIAIGYYFGASKP